MTQNQHRPHPAPALALLALLAVPAVLDGQHMESPPPPAYALENVTVVHADGRLDVGVNLVVRGGLIVAMGVGVEIPPDATLLEGDSLRIYPGLFDAQGKASLKLPEPGSAAGIPPWSAPRDLQGFTPHRLAAWYLTGTGADGKGSRAAGVVAAGVHPEGGMAPGQGVVVLFRKDARSPWETVVRPSLGLLFTFQGARAAYPGTLFAVLAQFRQTFLDAARHGLIQTEYARSPDGLAAPAWDPDFEALRRAASGELPVYFVANTAGDIRRVLGLAGEIGFRPVIVGGEEAWKVADELKARRVPVLVSVSFPAPREWKPAQGQDTIAQAPDQGLEPGAAREKARLENAYANPGRLAAAGITLALTSGGAGGDFRAGVAKAMEYGLSEGDALRAVTSTPATLLEVPHLATLRQGRSATFIVTDGPLFGKDTAIRWTFVDGLPEEGRKGAGGGGGEAPGASLAGSWEVRVGSQGMEIPFSMSLTHEGASFSGTMSSPETGTEARVESGRISGNSITFTLVVAMGAESMVLEASGTVEGDRITGAGSGAMGEFTFTATRKPGQEGGAR